MIQQASSPAQSEWIDPIGGLGDCLFLAGVLADVWCETGRTFGMCRRLPYSAFFRGHPAIVHFGPPPPGVSPIKVDYWSVELPGPGDARPYQILARIFGAHTPRTETLWVPNDDLARERLAHYPLTDNFVVVAPTSVSPRKMWPWDKWVALVERVRKAGRQVVQIGDSRDRKIPGTLSLCGYTTPRGIFSILQRAALAVVVDAFPLHASAAVGTPTVALWGPTSPEVFGYSGHTNVLAARGCATPCFETREYSVYVSPCDSVAGFCLAALTLDEVWARVETLL